MKKQLFLLGIASTLMFASDLKIQNEYIKITAPNAKNTAIFMDINNNSNADIKLIDAKCDFAKNTEIHTHIHEDGMMKMVRIKDITIPANGMVQLKPKSYHVMLLDINESVKEDTKVNLELYFDNNEVIKLNNIPAKAVIPMKH